MTEAPDGGPDKRRPGRDRLELDLGEGLRSVRTEVAGLRNDVRETAGLISEVMPRLEEVETDLAEAKGTLTALAEIEPSAGNAPVEWPALSAEEAEQEWEDLADWVGNTLVPWLQVTRSQLPDMWPDSPRAVFELSWLRTCYQQAYLKNASPTAAAEWHTRWLSAALENVRAAMPSDWEQRMEPAKQQVKSPTQHAPAGALTSTDDEPWKQYTPPPAAQSPTSYSYSGWREQLATREHWEQTLQHAKERDIGWRRERDQHKQI